MSDAAQSRFYQSHDGLKLHLRDVRPDDDGGRLPVVCLAGLTRSAEDFAVLAEAIASDMVAPRRVLAFDYRGRGRSDHDPDWHHYALPTERADILQGLALSGIDKAHFIGTSRGGLNIMAMAATDRALIASVVLNDIGPVLEAEGLARIKGYVGKMVAPRDFGEAIKLLKIGAAAHFDGLSQEEWTIFARTTFGTDETSLNFRYDPQIARTLDGLDLDKPLPESWDLYDALRPAPVLTLRGAHSDLLSRATLDAMGRRWPGCETFVVPGQGHAPLLADRPTISRILAFLSPLD